MTPALFSRYLLRESRGSRSRLTFFVLCLAIGVAAIVSVAGLSRGLSQGIRTEARTLLAGDLAVTGSRALPAELDVLLATQEGVQATLIKEMVTVVASPGELGEPGRSQVVELKVIGGDYPFYGVLRLEPAAALGELLTADTTVVAPDLIARLGLGVGDTLRVGGEPFRIAGVVVAEPDRIAGGFSIGPRVFLSADGFERTQLEQRGSRIFHRLLVKLPNGSDASRLAALADRLREVVDEDLGFDVETHTDALPSLRQGVSRVERFLGLVALLSLLLGGVGAAQTTRAWLATRMDAIAILRCLGLRPREVLLLYLGQAVLLGLLGSLIGAALALVILRLVPGMLGDLIPVTSFRAWQPAAIGRGVALGTGIAVLFCLPPLLITRRIPPLRVLRKDVEPLPPSRWVSVLTGGLVILGIWLTATLQSGSRVLGIQFTIGVLTAALLLALASVLLVKLLARGRARGPVWMRHGLAALGRPGAATLGATVALGIGVLLVLGLQLVESGLEAELRSTLPSSAPTGFLIDIQPQQWAGVERLLEQEGAQNIDSVPVVMARLTAIDGRPVKELVAKDSKRNDRRWALTREQRLTYLSELPPDNKVVEGRLWSDTDKQEVSVEAEFAEELGVSLGSTLEFDIQGVPIELHATSMRTVDWRTFGINFFLIVEPGVLDQAPQHRIATTWLPPDREQQIQDLLATGYPNVTLVKIREVLEKLAQVMERLATGVRFVGAFTVLAGIVILGGAVSAGTVRRGREIALLKTLGMTRRGVIAMLATEYALLGAVAGVIGTAGGVVLSWVVLTRGMELSWHFQLPPTALAVVASIVLTAATGIAASWAALSKRPVEVLRSE
ncbi:MAG: FtsX-like permease family protein [Thermoanaerobaculia bacterium]